MSASTNVLPCSSVFNFLHSIRSEPKRNSDQPCGNSKSNLPSDFWDVRLRNCRVWISGPSHYFWMLPHVMFIPSFSIAIVWESTALHSAAFVLSVLVVVLLCSKPKVIRIAARRVVATVQDTHTIRYGSKGDHPSDSMRARSDSLDVVQPVSEFRSPEIPHPTSSRLFHVAPETGHFGFREFDFLTLENKGFTSFGRHIAKIPFVMRSAPFGSGKLPYGAITLLISGRMLN